MNTISQRKIGSILLRLIERPRGKYHRDLGANYYFVCHYVNWPDYVQIGLVPTWSVVRAIQLFDLRCLEEARALGVEL